MYVLNCWLPSWAIPDLKKSQAPKTNSVTRALAGKGPQTTDLLSDTSKVALKRAHTSPDGILCFI